MIDTDASVKWNGIKGTASGTVKYNADFSALYGESENFPIEFDEKYYDQLVTISGSTKGDTKVTPSTEDPYLITRIENLSEDKTIIAKVDENEIFSVNFNNATLSPAVEVLPQDHNLGKYEKIVSELIDANVKIAANGEVTGNLKNVESFPKFSEDVSKQSGHYLPVRISKQYMGKEITVTGSRTTKITVNQESDLDFILRVVSTSSTFRFKDGENEFMKLTFKNATLE